MEHIITNKSNTFQPCIDDIKCKICCQWIGKTKNTNENNDSKNDNDKDNDETPTEYTSNIAEFGPLIRNPAIYSDAQTILDKGKHSFEVIIPKLNQKIPYNLTYVLLLLLYYYCIIIIFFILALTTRRVCVLQIVCK